MKNKKGYVEEPVPILDPIQQLDDGSITVCVKLY